MNMARTAVISLAALAGLGGVVGVVGVVGMAGCAGYETYPDIPNNFSMSDPNTTMMPPVMAAGLRWVVMKYPAGGQSPEALVMGDAKPSPFAINLPPKATWQTCRRVADEVGMGARPLTADNTELPIFHVTYVRVRGDEAQVTVIRPVSSLGAAPGGDPVPQEIKLQLRGGLNPWHVVGWREWQVGTGDVPEMHIVTCPPDAGPPIASGRRQTTFVPNPPANPKIGDPARVNAPE